MSISISSSSIGATSYVSSVSSSIASAASAATGDDSSDSSKVSGPAEMMNKLKALQKSDPAKFKEAMSAISKKLTDEADAATDDKQKAMLKDMASKFDAAGQSGDLSKIAPPSGASGAGGAGGQGGPPGGGGGHHHGGGGGGAKATSSTSSSSSSSSANTQPADANADGTVTEAEQEAYDQKEAAKGVETSSSSESKRAAHAYKRMSDSGPPSGMKEAMDSISSIVSQYAA